MNTQRYILLLLCDERTLKRGSGTLQDLAEAFGEHEKLVLRRLLVSSAPDYLADDIFEAHYFDSSRKLEAVERVISQVKLLRLSTFPFLCVGLAEGELKDDRYRDYGPLREAVQSLANQNKVREVLDRIRDRAKRNAEEDKLRQLQIGTVLSCVGCHKVYRLGEDAVVASLEFGLGLAGGTTIVFTSGEPATHEDLVSTLDVPPEGKQATLDRGHRSWELIQASLARGEQRKWRCRSCDAINAYSRNIFGAGWRRAAFQALRLFPCESLRQDCLSARVGAREAIPDRTVFESHARR